MQTSTAPKVLLVHNQPDTPSTTVECQTSQEAHEEPSTAPIGAFVAAVREGHTTACSEMPQYKNDVIGPTLAVLVVHSRAAVDAGHIHVPQFNKKCTYAGCSTTHQLHAAGCSKQHSCWPCMKQPASQLRQGNQYIEAVQCCTQKAAAILPRAV